MIGVQIQSEASPNLNLIQSDQIRSDFGTKFPTLDQIHSDFGTKFPTLDPIGVERLFNSDWMPIIKFKIG